jgi:hypothetical protein
MLRPTIAFELRTLFYGLSKSEGARRQPAGIGQHAIVEKLNLHVLTVVLQPRVGLLMELPQTPDARRQRFCAHSELAAALKPSGSERLAA